MALNEALARPTEYCYHCRNPCRDQIAKPKSKIAIERTGRTIASHSCPSPGEAIRQRPAETVSNRCQVIVASTYFQKGARSASGKPLSTWSLGSGWRGNCCVEADPHAASVPVRRRGQMPGRTDRGRVGAVMTAGFATFVRCSDRPGRVPCVSSLSPPECRWEHRSGSASPPRARAASRQFEAIAFAVAGR